MFYITVLNITMAKNSNLAADIGPVLVDLLVLNIIVNFIVLVPFGNRSEVLLHFWALGPSRACLIYLSKLSGGIKSLSGNVISGKYDQLGFLFQPGAYAIKLYGFVITATL